MAVDIVAIGLDLIERYGLIAIFILLVLDGAMLLPVFPGELVLIIAVTTYGTDPNGLVMLIILASAAGMVGSLMLYAATRGGGRRLVERYPGFFMMPKRRREKLEATFKKPLGQTLVLFLRLFPLTRVLVSIPAGLARMPLVRFIVLSTIGMVAYHAAFLWFAYETRRPGSPIEAQAAALREAYANPAWDFVQANAIITGIAVIVVGAIMSVRASKTMRRDPEATTGSLVGAFATATLFWGGLALLVGIYLEPESVYALAELGGVDIERVAAFLGFSPAIVLAAIAIVAVTIGWTLRAMHHSAKQKHKRHQHALAILEKERQSIALQHAIADSQARIAARRGGGPLSTRPERPASRHASPKPETESDRLHRRAVEFGERRPPRE